MVRQGSIADIRKAVPNLYEVRLKGDPDSFTDAVAASGATWKQARDGFLEISLTNGLGSEAIFRAASQSGVQIRHLTRRIPSLEDIFARAVGMD